MAASSEAPTKGGGGDPGPSEPEQPRPDEPGLPFRLRYLILLVRTCGLHDAFAFSVNPRTMQQYVRMSSCCHAGPRISPLVSCAAVLCAVRGRCRMHRASARYTASMLCAVLVGARHEQVKFVPVRCHTCACGLQATSVHGPNSLPAALPPPRLLLKHVHPRLYTSAHMHAASHPQLAEYGGIYGTAAVLLSVVTHVDAFGALHWDTGNVLLGLGLYAPVLLFDAVVGLPDWTSRPEDSARLLRLFFDPTTAVVVSGAAADGGAAPPSGGSTAANTGTVRVTLAAAAGGGSGSSAVPVPAEDDAAAAPPSGLWVASQRVRMAMELLQEQYIRNNPGSRLAPLQELMVLVVACLADEMLYRAVGLTLFSLWLRDRFYEAGADDIIGLPPLLGGAALELPTPDAAKWAALAVGASVGAAVYGLNAWREASMASSAAEASAAAAKKSFATSRLDPGSPGARSLERQVRNARACRYFECACVRAQARAHTHGLGLLRLRLPLLQGLSLPRGPCSRLCEAPPHTY